LVHVQDPLSKKRVEELGAEENKIKVIPWGVDLTKFSPDKKSAEWRKRLQEMPGPVITIIIRDEERRFVDTLANAIDTVTKSISDVNFVIVKSNELKKKIKPNNNLQFLDWISYSEIPFYLANSDLFIDPYYPERPDEIGHTYGLALLEAMACGKPVVATDIAGLAKETKERNAGKIVIPKDVKELANAIINVLQDKKVAHEMGINGRRLVEERYSWEKIAKLINGVYKVMEK